MSYRFADSSQAVSNPVRYIPVFLNRWAVARYRALASIIPGHERFFLEYVILVFQVIFMNKCFIVEIF